MYPSQRGYRCHGGSLNQLERHHSRTKQVAGCSERTSRRQGSSVEIAREKRQVERKQVLFHAAGYVRGPTAASVTKKGVLSVEEKRKRMFFEESMQNRQLGLGQAAEGHWTAACPNFSLPPA